MSSNNSADKTIQGREFGEPYLVDSGDICYQQPLYHLTEADYIYLKIPNPWHLRFATIFLGTTIGYALLIAGKFIHGKFNHWLNIKDTADVGNKFANTVNAWEIWVFVLSLIFMAVAYSLVFFLPNKKDKVLKNIEKHFQDNPPVIVRRR